MRGNIEWMYMVYNAYSYGPIIDGIVSGRMRLMEKKKLTISNRKFVDFMGIPILSM